MVLTMTRTRTQTTLNKLAQLIASVHGELAFLEELVQEVAAQESAGPGVGELARGRMELLLARKQMLLASREALYTTLRQFEPGIDPGLIGSSEEWRKNHGRKTLGLPRLKKQYVENLSSNPS